MIKEALPLDWSWSRDVALLYLEVAVARVFASHASQDHLLAAELHEWLTGDGHSVFLDQHLHDGLALGEYGTAGAS